MQFKYQSSPIFGARPAVDPMTVHFQRAVRLHQQGQLSQAQALYEQILSVQPTHYQALHLQGVIALQTGNYQRAVELIGNAIRLDPSHVAFHCNLGNALLNLGQIDAAVVSYDKALEIKSDFADAWANRGVALAALLQFEAAIDSYNRAIAANPNYAEAYCNRGTAQLELNQIDPAVASFDAAIAIRPEYANAYCARGVALQRQGKLDDAVASYRGALSVKPDLAEAHCSLASALLEQETWGEAFAAYLAALGLSETVEAKKGFVRCVKRAKFVDMPEDVRTLLIRAIREAWTRPTHLFAPAIEMVKSNHRIKEYVDRATHAWPRQLSKTELYGEFGLNLVASDPLMLCILECIPVSSIEMERFVTQTRRILLELAVDTQNATDQSAADNAESNAPLLALLSAIARQCYINEYVFCASDEELDLVRVLRERVDGGLTAQSQLSGWCLSALAAYSPLNTLRFAGALPNLNWPRPIAGLVEQQVIEPTMEQEYRSQIPTLTSIDDDISILVQHQYEENPYPRWIKAPLTIAVKSVETYLQQILPTSSLRPLEKSIRTDILVAGCGTGQQPIDTAQLFPNARVLAIDLSRSSLCYAKRKTEELGISNLEYAHADIMALGTLKQTFDLIESVGVLHHMADPVAGLQVLSSKLKPGGFMKLGLYSVLARQDIVAARQLIAERGYAATATDIRRCRQDLMSGEHREQFGKVLTFRDFFGMSECRDLLFHVQEHRFTLLQIKSTLMELGLAFLGFHLEAETANHYHLLFPDDYSLTNLDNWHLFEMQNPDTFAGMYQFWVQKIS